MEIFTNNTITYQDHYLTWPKTLTRYYISVCVYICTQYVQWPHEWWHYLNTASRRSSAYLYAILRREKWKTRLRPLQPRFLQVETNLPYNCALHCKTWENFCRPSYYLNLERRSHRVYADLLTYFDATWKKGCQWKIERRKKDRRLHI